MQLCLYIITLLINYSHTNKMINNLKEIIKNREQLQNNSQNSTPPLSSNDSKLNKLDQEIIHNYKVKLLASEVEINKVSEELNSTKRNFEALCFKNKEDVNLIRKLEEEISFLKGKLKMAESSFNSNAMKGQEEAEMIIKNYKDKIDSLNSIVKGLEAKMNGSINNHIKFQEKETFYRNFVSKLEEKNKNLAASNEALEKENSKLKKEVKGLSDDKCKTAIKLEEKEKELAELLQNLENMKSFIEKNQDNNEVLKKVRKEKDLIEKLLIESREKIRALDQSLKESNSKLNEEIKLLKEEYSNALKLNQSLAEENSSLRIKVEEYSKSLSDLQILNERIQHQIDKLKDLHQHNQNFAHNKNTNLIEQIKTNITKLLFAFEANFTEIFIQINKQTEFRINSNSNKLILIQNAITTEITSLRNNNKSLLISIQEKENFIKLKEDLLRESDNKINSLTEEALIKDLKTQSLNKRLVDSEECIKKLNYECDSNKFTVVDNENKFKELKSILEKKINKKRNKLITVKLELEKLKKGNEELTLIKGFAENKLESVSVQTDSEGSTEGLDKISKFTLQISTLCEKLKLSIDTISIILTCRSCSDENNKLQILQCGHSLCCKCIKTNKKCFECNSAIEKSFPSIENVNFNNIVTRFKFTKQINSDIDTIINYIKNVA